MKKGKFVVIEGIDSSGKGTQANLLTKRVKSLGKKVLTVDFPRYYSSEWGKMAGQFLTGRLGRFDQVHPKFAVLPYMLDQYTWARDIGYPWLKKGGHLILDRYFTSNVHQVAKLKTAAKKKYRDWLWQMGYANLGILKPDLVVFLNISPEYTKKLIKTKNEREYLKGRKKDYAEKNWQHQWSSYKEYAFMTKTNKDWISVKCINRGKIDTPEVIHERIWEKVSAIL